VPLGGQEVVEAAPGLRRIAVGNPQVADVTFVGGRLRIVGLTEGSTDIFLWSGSDQPDRIRVSVAAGLDAARAAAASDPALANARPTSEGGRIVLEGQVPDLDAHRRLTAPLRGREGVVDNTAVTGETVVAVEVMFAAVQATRLQQFGFNFRSLGTSVQGSITAPGATASSTGIGGNTYVPGNLGSSTPSLAALAGSAASMASPMSSAFGLLLGNSSNNILAAISALASTNFAQVLAQPTLLVRSGEQASFLAGGEIPVPTPLVGAGFNTVTVEYRPFGVRLEVAATVNSAGRITLRVNPEVSELDYTNAVTLSGFNIPAFRKRSASTTVELASGQSFMLAGMTLSNTSNLGDRIPALGQLPVIGALFSRTNASRETQELVIIATPRLVRPIDNARLPTAFTRREQIPGTLDMILQRNTPEEQAARFGLMR
jgi:pilus assembly protein CpaC